MAKVSAAFQCLVCKSPLQFPQDIDIIQFMIHILQFYRVHEICDVDNKAQPKAVVVAKKKRTQKGK